MFYRFHFSLGGSVEPPDRKTRRRSAKKIPYKFGRHGLQLKELNSLPYFVSDISVIEYLPVKSCLRIETK